MYACSKINSLNRNICVREKMQEFCDSKLVITDRLHGMIFATITGTPCIVFGNNHHKVRESYEWIKYLPYIEFVESVDEAKEAIARLAHFGNGFFENGTLLPLYDELRDTIKTIIKQ
jgi:pyruvyl transferase EpsI